MKRTGSFLAALFFLLTATLASSNPYLPDQPDTTASSAASSGSCQTKLGNNAYDCNVAPSFSAPFTDCYQFISPGSVSTHFDLFPVGLGSELGCSCDPTGSIKNPKFNGSPNAFDCDGGGGFDFAGKVTPTKISGHISSSTGDSFLFVCKKRSSSCE
jgi:hypothetical protein